MANRFAHPGRTIDVDAEVGDLALFVNDRAAARRAMLRHLELRRARMGRLRARARRKGSRRRRVRAGPCRLRARPCARISSRLCSEALEIVTPPSATGSSCATGVSEPMRPTVDRDLVDPGLGLLRLELVRDRPSRRARDLAELLLKREVVDLGHHAVGLVGKVVAPLGHLAPNTCSTSSTPRHSVATAGLTLSPSSRIPARNSHWVLNSTPRIRPGEWQKMSSGRAAVIRGSSWRSEPAAALRGLANSGSPCLVALRVELGERLPAAESLRRAPRAVRESGRVRAGAAAAACCGWCADSGDVFAVDAVAAGRADLQHRRPRRPARPRAPSSLTSATYSISASVLSMRLTRCVELAHLLGAHRVGERQHQRLVLDRCELFAGGGADALGGRVGRGDFRMRVLELAEPAHQASYSASEISGWSST